MSLSTSSSLWLAWRVAERDARLVGELKPDALCLRVLVSFRATTVGAAERDVRFVRPLHLIVRWPLSHSPLLRYVMHVLWDDETVASSAVYLRSNHGWR